MPVIYKTAQLQKGINVSDTRASSAGFFQQPLDLSCERVRCGGRWMTTDHLPLSIDQEFSEIPLDVVGQ